MWNFLDIQSKVVATEYVSTALRSRLLISRRIHFIRAFSRILSYLPFDSWISLTGNSSIISSIISLSISICSFASWNRNILVRFFSSWDSYFYINDKTLTILGTKMLFRVSNDFFSKRISIGSAGSSGSYGINIMS